MHCPVQELQDQLDQADRADKMSAAAASIEASEVATMATPQRQPPASEGESSSQRGESFVDSDEEWILGATSQKRVSPNDKSPGSLSEDGTQKQQPVIPENEPFDDGNWDQIPDILDASAPKPKLGEHHLSAEAIRSRTKRIFTPRADGSRKVSDEIWNDWKAKGSRKKLLEDIFKRCGYDSEPCLS